MKKVLRVEKLTNKKYLNLYEATFELDNGKQINYQIVSRKQNLDLTNPNNSADAVRILPYFFENGELKIVLIREFRFPINNYIYAVPAGLIDNGEDPIVSAKRELEEEIGASVVKIYQTEKKSYTSVGMSDESVICFEAEVKLDKSQKLEDREDISIVVVNLKELEKMLDTEDFGLQSKLQLRAFLYKKLLESKWK